MRCIVSLTMSGSTKNVLQSGCWSMLIFKTILVLLSTFAITACSSVYITEAQRTENTSFDGVWMGTINSSDFVHLDNKGYLSCSALQTTLELNVSRGTVDGEVSFEEKVSFSTFLNDQGRFFVDMPKESTYLINGRSRFGAHEHHVFAGVLDPVSGKGQGYYRDGFGQMQSGGCKYDVSFIHRRG